MNEISLKYPSTPHFSISTSADIRNDKVLETRVQNEIFNSELIIEEKIDGANLGISFNSEANIILQNRGSVLTPPFSGQWKRLDHWLSLKKDVLFDHLSDRFILFGEWCYAMHSIYYTSLPDYFLAFDIYDKILCRFISFDERNTFIKQLGIIAVPFIERGYYSLNKLPNFIKKSQFSDEIAEGIYVRASNENETFFRAKIVRSDFTENINQHWSLKSITINKLLTQKTTNQAVE